jgi:hypothetical protein
MRGFFRKVDEIDAVIKRGSSRENVLKLISMMTSSALTIYTLDLLDPSWLEPLESVGYFRDRPSTGNESGTAANPFWPVSRYLRKVAKETQGNLRIAQTLYRILSFMPSPDTYAIVRDMIDISISLPREMLRGVVPIIQRILSSSDNVEFVNVSELIISLTENNDISPALRLFATIFAVFRKSSDTSRSNFPSPAIAFMDNWHYREEMGKCLPPLMDRGGMRFLEHLCQLLDEHMRIDAKDKFQGPDDYSYIWRPAVEEHEQNTYDDPRDTLITAIRDCATFISARTPSQFPEIIEMMDSQQWFVFTRIMLYLLAESPVAPREMIAKYATEPYLFSEVGVRHEYSILLKNRFNLLSTDQQGTIFAIIENGPDQTSFTAHVQRNFNRPASQDERTSYQHRWQYDWLSYIQADLPSDWRSRFEDLKREIGDIDDPSFPVYRSSGAGQGWSEGPAAGREQHMTIETLLGRGHQEGAMVLSGEELWRIAARLRNLTEMDRGTVSARTEEIALLPVMLVDAITSGLLDGVKQSDETLPTVLRLATAIVTKATVVDHEADQEALLAIATRIIHQVVPTEIGQVNQEQLETLTALMSRLLTFVKSGPTGHAIQASEQSDPLNEAINTLGGRIVDTGIRLALFERKLIGNGGDDKQGPNWLFGSLSEILLRLTPHERSVTAILGYRFPFLMQLSPSWAAEYAQHVFPLSATQSERWFVAWGSYVTRSGAHDTVFEVLQPQYAKAVSQLAGNHLPSSRDREFGLAQHLAGYYWRARITLRDKLFQDFMLLASEGGISAFLSTIGRGVQDRTATPVGALQALADWILSKWKSRRRAAKKALSAFGWWFPHPALGSPLWRIELLRKAVTKAGSAQNLDQVLTALEQLALELPDQVLRCLRALAYGSPNESISYHLASRSVPILEKAAEGVSAASVSYIGEIADHFGSLGNFQYRRFAARAL